MVTWSRKKDPAPYETAELIISGIIPMFLIVIGTIGNLICIIILLNKENRQTSTNIYLIFLCLVDTISLYQWNLSRAVDTFTDGQKPIWGQSLFLCEFSHFLAFYALHTSAMFLSFVELDRACLLRSRWYKIKIARPFVAFIFCTIILVTLFALNGFLLGLGFEYSTYNNSTGIIQKVVVCYYSLNTELNNFYLIQYSWVSIKLTIIETNIHFFVKIHLVIMYFLPFTVIITCTLLTVKKLILRQTTTNDQLARSAQRNRRISVMLLLMCLTYVICTLPNRLCFSVFADQIIGHDYTDTVFLATNTLMFTRNAMNAFFLYISVYGFRQHIRKFVVKCLGKQLNEVDPTNRTTTKNNMATITVDERQLRMRSNSFVQ
ncbi:unnamed protein product [Rotaria sp. Silwood2]|nr:unnamed protein product [Rotaria sp. Silwood2]CAF4358807.1 unnamed protein product [Rotaria sp. Silwood2]